MLSLDGGLLASCLNAASLALVDAGVPMPSVLAAATAGVIPAADGEGKAEPVLDLSNAEEMELPFLTVGTVGDVQGSEDKVSVLMMESRVQTGGKNDKLERMMAVGVDGCKQIRRVMEGVVRAHGAKVVRGMR